MSRATHPRARPGRRHAVVGAMAVLAAVVGCAILAPSLARAAMEPVHFDTNCDLARLRRVLVEKVFRDGGGVARVWDDETGCNHLTLTDPEVRPGPSGEQFVVRMRAEGRKSWKVGAWCSFPFDWAGSFALGLEPRVDRDSGRLALEVRSATAEDANGRAQPLEGPLREWIRDRVEPRFSEIRLSPGELFPGLDRVLPEVVPGPVDDAEVARRMVESIGFDRVALAGDGVELGLRFDVDAVSPGPRFAGLDDSARRLASAESLRLFDAFTTFVAQSTADETSSRTAREALFGVLLEERHAMVAELALGTPADPTAPARALFAATWPALAREVRRAAADVPPEARDRYAGFLASGEALRAIAGIGENSPLEIGADGLRALARSLAPDAERDPLPTGDEVDPGLRAIFGFGPPPERTVPPPAEPDAGTEPSPSAESLEGPSPGAPSVEPTPVATPSPLPDPLSRLARWVPTGADADAYLATVREGLDHASAEVAATMPSAPSSLAAIVEAIAWQVSCWRFWVVRGEQVAPFVSPSGGVGWLGVDPRIWRGFHDPALLRSDPGYDARAGAEIAARLASPALRATGEDASGREAPSAESAVREAAEIHALYDGGPAELRRLREGRASAAEVERSRGFREKFARLRAGAIPSAAECFGAEMVPPPSPRPQASAGDAVGSQGPEDSPPEQQQPSDRASGP